MYEEFFKSTKDGPEERQENFEEANKSQDSGLSPS